LSIENLPQEVFIPRINKLKNPYKDYFSRYPFNCWSFEHFKRICVCNYSMLEFDNEEFLDNIRQIRDDSGTLKEIGNLLDKVSFNHIF